MIDRLTELTELTQFLPKMLTGQELMEALTVLPEYDSVIVNADGPARLMALTDLYRIYVPGQMSVEIYSKLYIALMRSLQKKGTKLAVLQQLENRKAIQGMEYRGLVGGVRQLYHHWRQRYWQKLGNRTKCKSDYRR